MIKERRKNRRIDFSRPVSVTTDAGERWSCRSMDFCMEGIRLLADREPVPGDEVRVVMNLAAKGKRARTVSTRGTVTHCEPRVDGYSVGVHFLH